MWHVDTHLLVCQKFTESRIDMYEIWDGDLFLFAVDTEYEADEQAEAGFRVVGVE